MKEYKASPPAPLPHKERGANNNNLSTTICAPATASGGAIGIIRVSGPDAVAFTNAIFSKDISQAKGYTMHYGQIPGIDEVLVSVSRAPHSYTGENTVEISHHGSSFIKQAIIERLLHEGCEMARPGEFTQRAFLNGKMDLSQAEAVADLIASQNAATHRIALQQMRGGYSIKLSQLRDKLLEMTSLLELELDFSEEDVEFAEREKLILLANDIKAEITRLTDSFRLGNAIKNGVPVAIIGAPNVGKSTLLNALLHEDKAIVSEIQGTTRDTVEDTITIGDITFRFIDTAGIRHTDDTIERLGIERSIKAAEKAQIIILMRDNESDYPAITIRDDQTVIKIVNKQDTCNTPLGENERALSALNGIGIDALEKQLLAAIPTANNDELLVTNLRHYEALSRAKEDITRSIESLELNISGDIVSEDLRQCLFHLGEILGNITSDEVLGNIFKNFCIGK